MVPLLRLREALREHRGPLRADFRREYGIDLDAVLSPESSIHMPADVLLDLIDGLSPQAAYWRAVAPDRAAWGLSEQLLAELNDRFALLCWGLGGQKGAQPKPIPRPGVEPDEEVVVIGASKGFDSIEEFENWYQKRRHN